MYIYIYIFIILYVYKYAYIYIHETKILYIMEVILNLASIHQYCYYKWNL